MLVKEYPKQVHSSLSRELQCIYYELPPDELQILPRRIPSRAAT